MGGGGGWESWEKSELGAGVPGKNILEKRGIGRTKLCGGRGWNPGGKKVQTPLDSIT